MDKKTIGITDDRLKHMRQVAIAASEYARDLFAWDEAKCEDMFLAGFLHDFAYHFVSDQREHEHAGGEILRRNGYQYWQEIYSHGDPEHCCDTDEGFILNLADMTVKGDGSRVSLRERLEDIAARHSTDSVQYVRARQVAEKLQTNLENMRNNHC